MSDEAVAPDEALGFFTVYATIPLVDTEPTGPTYDGRDTYLAWGHHTDSEVHAAVRAYWDETGYPTPELQRLANVEPRWAVLAHGKDAPEDEGWYFTWDDVSWATPHAFRVTLVRTVRGSSGG